MANGQIHSLLHHLRRLVIQESAGQTDRALLERFLTERDESAFAALVRRHGPTVLGVCQRVLQNPHDAEDAFQATFLVFVRKAASISKRELLGNWLYGVAYHTARAARTAAGLRRAKEAQVMPRQETPVDPIGQELRLVLDQELSRLPDKYRIPIVFCDLEGKSRRSVAQELALPEGTLSSRLARGRAILARRLGRRGFAVSAAALAAELTQQATAADVPTALVFSTVRACTVLAAGQLAAAGLISTKVAALSNTVLRSLFLAKLKIITVMVLTGTVLVIGTGGVASLHLGMASRKQAKLDGTVLSADPLQIIDDASKALLQEALHTAGSIADPLAKCHTLSRIATVQSKQGDRVGARKTRLQALEIAKELANGRSKVIAIADIGLAQVECGDRAEGLQTLREAQAVGAAISDPHEKGNALIPVLIDQARLGEYEDALRTVASSGDFELAALETFAGLVPVKKGNEAGYRKALERAVEMAKGTRTTGNKQRVLCAIAAAYARVGDVQGALRLANELDASDKLVALRKIAIAQARIGDIAGALRTGKVFAGAESRANLLDAVAVAQAKAGDRAAAETTLQEVRQIAEKLRNGLPGRAMGRSAALRVQEELARTQVRMGDLPSALQTAAGIDSDYEKASALVEIGIAQAAAGQPANAKQTLRDAARAAEKVIPGTGGDTPTGRSGPLESAKAATLRQIAWQQAKLGDIQEALRTVESIPTEMERDTALGEIVPARAEAGDVKGALETLQKLKDIDWKAYALENLVNVQVKAGDEPGALALAADQQSPVLKVHALLGVIMGKGNLPASRRQP
ncbi:MAG TPA: sigma-70 family RNA polymerase sigma factor [Gemmataceae bacterium]|nr:sigma-70 family RNA polymerase sigma factor [Gemmataceae bacterium]